MYRYTADGHVDYPHVIGGLDTCGHPDCLAAIEEDNYADPEGIDGDLLDLTSAVGDAVARGERPDGH